VITRMSTLFLRTLREDPADAEVPSHRLLVRAGYVRRAAPGIYSWLPLGYTVLRNVERIVRDEMNAIGAQEVHFPALLPREPYEATGRWTEYGDNLFRLKDRKGNDYLLGPTHEEMFTLLVKDIVSSYKSLPLALYQIQTKYRDEARPRAGILRGREFVMKDSYSFDRLGLRYVIVAAMSGAMGGSASEEFLADAEVGEDTYVKCTNCDYAANVEAVQVPAAPALDPSALPLAQVQDTPETPTIDTLVAVLNERFPRSDRPWVGSDTLKNLLVNLRHPDGTIEPLAIGVPGDREVDPKRLEAQVAPAEVEPFTDVHFAANAALVKGYIGPGVLGEHAASGIRFLLDPSIAPGSVWVTGADQPGRHIIGLVAGRDFSADGTIQAAEIRDGDECPVCGHALATARGIEMGHIFQLGRKYAEALDAKVLDVNGKLVTVTMGSYGIGVSRAVAAIAENSNDERGLIWPREIAPADVHVVIAGKTQEIIETAEIIAAGLDASGIRVMLDDRSASVGVKLTDAELLGVPTICVVGRGVADGLVEIRDRVTGSKQDVSLAEIAELLREIVRA